MNERRFAGKVVLITGAAGGIGRSTAVRFAKGGATVVGWDLCGDAGNEFEAEMQQAGGKGYYQRTNVTDSGSVQHAVSEIVEKFGRIDVLINNAGITRDGQLAKKTPDEEFVGMPEENWDAVINVNLKGVFLTTRAVAPQMIRQGSGVILTAASVVGVDGNFGQTNYAATKAGVIGMTRTWARELGKYNIRVNAVAPGFIATDMTRAMPEAVLQNLVAHTPLKRLGTPEDVANVYAWLASDEASFVHGSVLAVDGGVVLGT